ncbi:unnamed protein product [Rodentolepis nana]|uniref:TIR domain-containing protein n=1 Tax=Rodentolepis nana TaxID=102285 RepID=A0A0R3T649_RODNA|nr:unnamed protein product [Rodentolepis nana]
MCLDVIVNDFTSLIVIHQDPDTKYFSYSWQNFPSNIRIPPQLAKELIKRLKICGKFSPSLFTTDYTMLSSFELNNLRFDYHWCSPESLKSLQMRSLNIAHASRITFKKIVSNLNSETRENLTSLNITGMRKVDASGFFHLRNLSSLDISYTRATAEDLQFIVTACSHLKYLDISVTPIEDISCLLSLKDQLEGLFMHFQILPKGRVLKKMISIIVQLVELRRLEFSCTERQNRPFPPLTHFCSSNALIHLEHFDISGNPLSFPPITIRHFIENHPKVEFLGLAFWPSFDDAQEIYEIVSQHPHIVVSGDTSEELLVEKLRRYGKRLELCDYMLRGFSFESHHREIVSPSILKAVLNIGEVIPNDPILNDRLHEAVTYIMENLNVDDLTFELCQQVMQYTLSYILRFESGYQLLRLLINKFGIIPDGTYLNIQSKCFYMLFLMRYIDEMGGHEVDVDIFHPMEMLSAPTGQIRENPDVIWSLYKSLKGSEVARITFQAIDGLGTLGGVERVSLSHLHKSVILTLILRNWHNSQSQFYEFCLILHGPSFKRSYMASRIIRNLISFAADDWNSTFYFHKNDILEAFGKAICQWEPPFDLSHEEMPPLGRLEYILAKRTSRLEVKLWALWSIRHLYASGMVSY